MKPKKTKAKKLKSSSLKRKNKIDLMDLRAEGEKFWKSPAGISIIASAKGLSDPYAKTINVFDEAAKIKNFNQLERFFEKYMPGVSAADAAKIVSRHVKDNWTLYKILKDPENHGAVLQLINWIDSKKGGAVAAYNHRVLKRFMMLTGYKKPPSVKTFQNEMTIIKDHFGLSRKKTGEYTRKQLEAAAAKLKAKKIPK